LEDEDEPAARDDTTAVMLFYRRVCSSVSERRGTLHSSRVEGQSRDRHRARICWQRTNSFRRLQLPTRRKRH